MLLVTIKLQKLPYFLRNFSKKGWVQLGLFAAGDTLSSADVEAARRLDPKAARSFGSDRPKSQEAQR